MLSEISTVALGQKVAAPLAGLGDRPFSSDSVKKKTDVFAPSRRIRKIDRSKRPKIYDLILGKG